MSKKYFSIFDTQGVGLVCGAVKVWYPNEENSQNIVDDGIKVDTPGGVFKRVFSFNSVCLLCMLFLAAQCDDVTIRSIPETMFCTSCSKEFTERAEQVNVTSNSLFIYKRILFFCRSNITRVTGIGLT